MTYLFDPAIDGSIAAALIAGAAWSFVAGARRLVRGLRDASSIDVVRGIRVAVFGLVGVIGAVGFLSARPGFLILAGVILAEELYETGLLALIVRSATSPRPSASAPGGAAPPPRAAR